ncbi:MAG TPA: hypothetical protein VHM02_08950 [Thermoanaerobaculia bacterium]|nr:hypothetical protein [Thermoanaerobaculia bacterium]
MRRLVGRPSPSWSWSLAVLLALVAWNAAAQPPADPPSPAVLSAIAATEFQSTFCEGTYALCIKAPCSAIPTLDRIGNYYVEHALCECDVVRGWSMGPGSCPDRAPMEQHGRTYLISTYSNLYNAEEKTLTCGEGTTWAWCYGAPCVVDEKDPSKATCTCPVETGPGSTLGGDCRTDACGGIWSAATPAGDAFANRHYYDWMQRNQPGVSVDPPAAACTAPPASGD